MTKAEKAAAWAESVAADDGHGYDQGNRWGPDYDCSSLVIQAYENAGAGVKSRGATYTGNMRGAFLAGGFRDVTGEVSLASGAGLRRGDVLLNAAHHTAMYVGNGRIVHAAGNEFGGATGGRTGDQTGREIGDAGYFNFPWDCVLRYEEESGTAADLTPSQQREGTYVVQSGDSLWSIAEKLLGSGFRYPELMESSGLTSTVIYPGMELRLPGAAGEPSPPEKEGETCAAALPRLRPGDAGEAVRAAQTLLCLRREELPLWGADGEYGAETEAAVRAFRDRHGLGNAPEVDGPAWEALVTGKSAG